MSTPKKLLLVDDNTTFLRHVRRFLSGIADFTVLDATSKPEEAVHLAIASNPDVCIIDLSMPGMTGLELAPRLKEALPDLRVVVLTSHEDFHYREAARHAMADAFVVKSRLTEDLPGAIRGMDREIVGS